MKKTGHRVTQEETHLTILTADYWFLTFKRFLEPNGSSKRKGETDLGKNQPRFSIIHRIEGLPDLFVLMMNDTYDEEN